MTEKKLLDLLQKHNLKFTTAESCTAGLVSGILCDIAGISNHFEEGFVTYSEDSKINTLSVSPETINTYGVVSMQVADEMARGAAAKTGADCAIATTGYAGPTGDEDGNRVGTICFACFIKAQNPNESTCFLEEIHFDGNRMQVRMQGAVYAIEMLCEYIEACYTEALNEGEE